MKKILSFALALILLLVTFSACGNTQPASSDPITEAPESDIPAAEVDTPDVSVELPQRAAFATTAEEFTLKLQELVDLSKYEVDQDDSDYISYDLAHEFDFAFNFDYTLSFADGSGITLPVTFKDMEKTGWSTEAPADFQISNKIQRLIPYTNSNGQEITLWTTNLAAIDSDGDVNCNLSACTFYQLQIDICTEESTKNENGEYIDLYQRNPKAPNFTVFNAINQDASIADVINTIGAPSIIDFRGDSNKIRLTYYQKENDGLSSLIFTFAADGDYLVSISYKYCV